MHTHSLIHTHAHTHSLSHTLTHAHSLSHTHTHTHTYTHTHSYTHTHTHRDVMGMIPKQPRILWSADLPERFERVVARLVELHPSGWVLLIRCTRCWHVPRMALSCCVQVVCVVLSCWCALHAGKCRAINKLLVCHSVVVDAILADTCRAWRCWCITCRHVLQMALSFVVRFGCRGTFRIEAAPERVNVYTFDLHIFMAGWKCRTV